MDEKNEVNGVIADAPVEHPPIDVQPPATGPRKPGAPIQLTEAESTKVENFALKLENMAYRKQSIQDTIAALNQEERAATEGLKRFKEELGAKYGMDPMRIKVRKDGTLIEEPAPARATSPSAATVVRGSSQS